MRGNRDHLRSEFFGQRACGFPGLTAQITGFYECCQSQKGQKGDGSKTGLMSDELGKPVAI